MDLSPSTTSGSVVSEALSSSGNPVFLRIAHEDARHLEQRADALYDVLRVSSKKLNDPAAYRAAAEEAETNRFHRPQCTRGAFGASSDSRRFGGARSIRRGYRLRDLFLGLGLGHLFESRFEDLIHLADEDELEIVFHLGRDFVEIGLVALRNEDTLDARPDARRAPSL